MPNIARPSMVEVSMPCSVTCRPMLAVAELGAEGDQVQDRAAEPVQPGDLQGVAGAQQLQHEVELGPGGLGPAGGVDVDVGGGDAGPGQGVDLVGWPAAPAAAGPPPALPVSERRAVELPLSPCTAA